MATFQEEALTYRAFHKSLHLTRGEDENTSNTGRRQRGRCACSSPRQRQRQPWEGLWAGQGLIMDGLALAEIIAITPMLEN